MEWATVPVPVSMTAGTLPSKEEMAQITWKSIRERWDKFPELAAAEQPSSSFGLSDPATPSDTAAHALTTASTLDGGGTLASGNSIDGMITMNAFGTPSSNLASAGQDSVASLAYGSETSQTPPPTQDMRRDEASDGTLAVLRSTASSRDLVEVPDLSLATLVHDMLCPILGAHSVTDAALTTAVVEAVTDLFTSHSNKRIAKTQVIENTVQPADD